MPLSLPAPTTPDPMDAPSRRWGILGPGGIADSFCAALAAGTRQQVVACGSRSAERAAAFAARHGGTAHASYEALVADPRVEIVYVASPHSEHRDHALLAIEAGKHVLVEKAFTRNVVECDEVHEAARAAGVFCMEAMWARFLPHYDVIRQSVAQGLVGEVRQVVADHGQRLYPGGPQRLSDPALAGGAMLDLAVYPISLSAMVIPDIAAVEAVGTLTPEGVDASECVTLVGAQGEVAVCIATMEAQTENTAVVAGTGGRLVVDGWFYQPGVVRLVAEGGGELDRYVTPDREHGLHYEAAEVARCVAAGLVESPLMPWAETRRVMDLMDRARRQIGVRYPGE